MTLLSVCLLIFLGFVVVAGLISVRATREKGMGFWSTVWAVMIALSFHELAVIARPLFVAAFKQAGVL